ncbi:T9SS type A sorting domain-containing protein [Fulvivirga sp. M361]|uniref:T9SS type A sorting domain-containing protein n=1 Tax=Fulvivirga sp. M361 TaxID=2594266 RepID=UPI001179FBCF|nr:T9SS type A sorting domain-containing protein [Fulvivirga sp. M361]TRX55519.1 T9SS type A sorting domain-containing protein [Fulvivirga sp. M361]
MNTAASIKSALRPLISIFIFVAFMNGAAYAQLTYWLDQSVLDSPYESQIRRSMDSCVTIYNRYSNYTENVKVIYSASVPTANASYKGRIAFGGSRGQRTALHEMAHVLGVGTYSNWGANRDDEKKVWTGPVANALIMEYNGADAVLHADKWHFWPYGLNSKDEDVQRHVYMVGALREDMGLSNTSGQGNGCFPSAVTSQLQVNQDSPQKTSFAFVKIGDALTMTPGPANTPGSWSWEGPNNFTASNRQIALDQIQMDHKGVYNVTYTNECGAKTQQTFRVVVNSGNGTPYYYLVLQTDSLKMRPEHAGGGAEMVHTTAQTEDHWVQWEKIDTDSSYFLLKNRETKKYFRPIDITDASRMVQVPGGSLGHWVQWKLVGTRDGYAHIVNRHTQKKLRIISQNSDNPFIEQAKNTSTGEWTRWVPVFASEEAVILGNEPLRMASAALRSYPNPFNGKTAIGFTLPKNEIVYLYIYDMKGQKVHTLIPGIKHAAGNYSYEWSGQGQNGTTLLNGLYIIQLITGEFQTHHSILFNQ